MGWGEGGWGGKKVGYNSSGGGRKGGSKGNRVDTNREGSGNILSVTDGEGGD